VIVNSTLIRRGLPVTLVMTGAILMQPAPASAGGSYFSIGVGFHSSYYGHHHGHHLRAYWPWFYGHAAWPVYPYPVAVGYPGAPPVWQGGAVDVEIKPKQTEIYIDGTFVGPASRFDGYPNYLWLEPGSHTLTLYRTGYRTLEQRVEVQRGMITDLRLDMSPLAVGEEASPPLRAPAPAPPPVAGPGGPTGAPPPAPAPPGPILDLRGDGGAVRLVVEPPDASIYLDGRFVGTGADVGRLHGGLLVDPGAHVVEVVHPRHVAERVSFRVAAGEQLEVRLELEAAPVED
jgi:hypothetical protein